MAIAVRQPETGLWFHSDRGIEYAALDYQAVLIQYGIKPCMNRPRQCTDNAHMESSSTRSKVSGLMAIDLKETDLRVATQQYIDHFYNPVRLHSAIGYQSPMAMEATD